MDIPFSSAMLIVGVAILALLIVLSVMAGLIYFLTGVIKDNEETEEEMVEAPPVAVIDAAAVDERAVKTKIALIAVSLARAAQMQSGGDEEPGREISSWRQFYMTRRLNQSLSVRRSS